MHALRWNSLKHYFSQKQAEAIARNDWRAEPYFRHLVASFDDDWEDVLDLQTPMVVLELTRLLQLSCTDTPRR